MAKIETYRKRAKQIVRWHREGNYSVGGKVRQVERIGDLKDADVLAMPPPLALAQEVVAVEAGFAGWVALKASLDGMPAESVAAAAPARLEHVIPILFGRDVARAAAFYVDKLGFTRDFLHGNPPFYGAVSAMRRASTSGWSTSRTSPSWRRGKARSSSPRSRSPTSRRCSRSSRRAASSSPSGSSARRGRDSTSMSRTRTGTAFPSVTYDAPGGRG